MNLKVSIVIPIYKVEQYIERCICSVLNQTYRNLEVILVDDCTPDSSMDIAKRVIEKTGLTDISFVYLRHNRNRGLSAARNTGMNACDGEYLFFLDSDDYLTENCIELMVHALKKHDGTEMVVGNIKQIGKAFDWPDFYMPGIHNTDIIELACSYRIYTMAWNKLIRKDFLFQNNLFFKEGLYHEDVLWNFQVACILNQMIFIPEETYCYVIHENSIQTNPSFKFHYINRVNVKMEMIKFVFEKELSQNRTIFNYISSDIYELLFESRNKGEIRLAQYFYKKWRLSPYWSLGEVVKFSSSRIEKLRALHRILPQYLGIPYLCFIQKLFNCKNKLL